MTFEHFIQNDFTVNKYLELTRRKSLLKKILANSKTLLNEVLFTYYQIIDI